MEGREPQMYGVQFSVANKTGNIIDLVIAYLEMTQLNTVYAYHRDTTVAYTPEELIKQLKDPDMATPLFNNFLGVRTETNFNRKTKQPQGRRFASFHCTSLHTYRENKRQLIESVGGTQKLQAMEWYVNKHDDTETLQSLVGFI